MVRSVCRFLLAVFCPLPLVSVRISARANLDCRVVSDTSGGVFRIECRIFLRVDGVSCCARTSLYACSAKLYGRVPCDGDGGEAIMQAGLYCKSANRIAIRVCPSVIAATSVACYQIYSFRVIRVFVVRTDGSVSVRLPVDGEDRIPVDGDFQCVAARTEVAVSDGYNAGEVIVW